MAWLAQQKTVVGQPQYGFAQVKRPRAQRFSPGARHAFLVFTRVLLGWHLAVFVLASPGVVMKISATHNGCRNLENRAQSRSMVRKQQRRACRSCCAQTLVVCHEILTPC